MPVKDYWPREYSMGCGRKHTDPVQEQLRWRKENWLAHMRRRNDDSIARQAPQYTSQGRRGIGSPTNTPKWIWRKKWQRRVSTFKYSLINHLGVLPVYRESDKAGRHITEAIWIRKMEDMNRDEGSYQLSHVWDKLLHTDDRHRKSVLMKVSDMKPKRR